MQAVKRGRTTGTPVQVTPDLDATTALLDELGALRIKSTADLAAKDAQLADLDTRIVEKDKSETRLITRNDELNSRLHSVEARMDAMRIEMQQMHTEMQQLRPLVPLVQRITSALGLTASVPPAAPVECYIDCITGLKKAASVASITHAKFGTRTDLCADNDRLRDERDRLRDERNVHHAFKNQVRKLARNDAIYKHFTVWLHPDKRARIPIEFQPAADALFEQMLDARKRLPVV